MTTTFDLPTSRVNAGLSIRALARELEIPEASIRRLEGGGGISLAYAKKIADHFGVTVLDVLPGALDRSAA